jgi:hypothetical protein
LYARQRRLEESLPVAEAVAVEEPKVVVPVATAISFSCAACGKKLKARAALAGKKIKCPGCDKPVRIPAIQNEQAGPPSLEKAVQRRSTDLPSE